MSAAGHRTRVRMLGEAGRCLAATCTIVAGFLSGPAAADRLDTLNVVAGGTTTQDSNILRRPASADRPGDTVKVVYAGLRIDKAYSQQRFQLDYTDTRTRFANLSQRNSDAIDYRGAWLWHLTPRISGTLDAEQKQTLVEGDESQGTARNLRTTTTRKFSLDGSVFGGWHLLLGANQTEQTSESSVSTSPDFRSVDGQAGARYEAGSGSSISVIQHTRQGEYGNRELDPVNLLDNRYYERESELKLTWKASGRSALSGRLAWLARRHEHFPQRDFSGPIGGLDYNLTVTGKTRVNASAKRSISATSDPFSSYRVENALSVSPQLQMSEKTSLQLRLDYSMTDFRGPVVPPPGPLRRDVQRRANLSANWEISRNATVSASVQRQRRSSNDPQFGFEATIISVNAKLTF